jgi:hypothetical protein
MLQSDLGASITLLNEIRVRYRPEDFLLLLCHLRVSPGDVLHPLWRQADWNTVLGQHDLHLGTASSMASTSRRSSLPLG